jgi:hypothetical protein
MTNKSIALAPNRGQKAADGVVRVTAKGAVDREAGAAGLGDSTATGVPADS